MSAQSEEGGSGIHQGKMWKPHFHLLSRDRLLALRARSPRISVIRILFASVFPLLHCWLPNLDFSGSYAKDYYFCEPCCICVYKTRYVPMKGSIRKSIVALLQRSFAVYRYVFAFIFPCFAVGHCLEMDVSISLVSCRRDYCINPSASLFFFSFFRRLSSFLLFFFPHVSSLSEEGEIGKLLGVTPLLYIIRFEGLLEAWIKLLNGRKTLLNVLCDIPLVSGIIHERFKSLNECFLSVVFNYISRRVCMYVYMLFIFVVKVI